MGSRLGEAGAESEDDHLTRMLAMPGNRRCWLLPLFKKHGGPLWPSGATPGETLGIT